MTIDREAGRAIAQLPIEEATQRLRQADHLDPDGLDALLVVARSLIRDDPADGRRLAELVRSVADAAGAPAAVPRATYLLAQAAAGAGDLAEALALIEAARADFDRLGNTTEALRTNLGRSQALNEMGRHDDALAACGEILDAFGAAAEHDVAMLALVAAAHQNSGLCLELSGQFEAALDHYASATIGYQTVGDSRAVAEVTYDRALVLLSLGQHAEALAALQRATSAFREGGFRALEVMSLTNTAEVQLHRGEYQQCLDSLAQASAALEGISAPGGEQARLVVAGRAYLALNLLPEATASFTEAVRLLAGTDLVIERARAQWGLGQALARTGRIVAASSALTSAAQQFQQSGQSSWLAEVLLDEARLERAVGDEEAAIRFGEQAAVIALRGTPAAAAAALLVAELSGAAGLDALVEVRATIDEIGLAPMQAGATHALGRSLLAAGRITEALATLRDAVDSVEDLRSSLAHETVLTRFLDDRLAPYHDLLDAAIAAGEPAAEALRIAELAKSRTLSDVVSGLVARGVGEPDDDPIAADLRALYGELFSGEATADPERAERLRDRVQDLEARRGLSQLTHLLAPDNEAGRPIASGASLPPGTVAVVYARAGDSMHAFVIRDGEVTLFPSVAGIAPLAAMVARLRRQWDRFRLGTDLVERHLPQLLVSVTAALHDLHNALIGPIASTLAGIAPSALIIVPDSLLHEVPFHALWTGERWLLESYEIRYSPSLGMLGHLPPPRGGRTLVAGTSDELAPMVLDEVRAVAASRPDAITLAGEAATWAAVRAELGRAAHIHLAGHAMFRPDNPMYSVLRMHDHWVTAADVLALDLAGTTIVLSACDTARTQHAGAAEINGFVRGFLGAGASTVIASQWTADDAATTAFMRRFYAALTDMPAAGALRAAQMQIAEQWPHPYFWAPWILVGRSTARSLPE